MTVEEIKAACNKPSTLAVTLYAAIERAAATFALDADDDEMFHEWLTNGANEHPLEYWVRYWRTGEISPADLKEQNTFAYGFLEALRQSPRWPNFIGEGYRVVVTKQQGK